ncbi:hypothetical protein [Falsiroseomonas sp.]|uniref:hypothetical protein n=1 Tax=Falsiroseomonas sp. TaxID=2870721 RepID=UPI00271CC7BA|nr:hypothetical protein [Falsiroseomonas sp.]MDO9501200.1 hypothetical protein [Falsiroseomonas sp.]
MSDLLQHAAYRFSFSAEAVAKEAEVDFHQGAAIALHIKVRSVSRTQLVLIANDWRSENGGPGRWGREVALPLIDAIPPVEVVLMRQQGRIDLEVPGHGRIGFPRLSTLSTASAPLFAAELISSLPPIQGEMLSHRATLLFREEAVLLGQSVNYHRGDDVVLHLNLRHDTELRKDQLALVLNDRVHGEWGRERRMGIPVGAHWENVEINLFEGDRKQGLVIRGPDGRWLGFGRVTTLDGVDSPEIPSGVELLAGPSGAG